MPPMKLSSKNIKLLAGLSLVLLALTGFLFLYDSQLARPWKKYQRRFAELDTQLTKQQLAEAEKLPNGEKKTKKLALLHKRLKELHSFSPKIRQLWLRELGRTDRCMTCHMGVEYPRFADAPLPLTTHPGKHISPNRHPVETYGCTICHEGQGVALTFEDAHGEAHNWVEPFLPGTRAESSCTACHPMGSDVPEKAVMVDGPEFSQGRTLYLENNCLGCHVVDGYQRPKSIGPVLTKIGTKTHQGWTRSWIKAPKKYLAKTVMPDFELPDPEIQAITAYLFSLSKPADSNANARAMLDTEGLADRGKEKLTELGCLGCHAIDGKDGGFGPDLSRVGEKATPEWLYAWIRDPQKYWPETAMPNLRVPEKDVQLLVAYLSTRKGKKPFAVDGDDTASVALVEKGKRLARDKGCTGCHKIDTFALGFNAPEHNGIGTKRVEELIFADTDIPHTLPDWLKMKVKNPRAFTTEEIPTLMPKFGFNDDQAEAILTMLLSMRKHNIPAKFISILEDPKAPSVRGELIIEQHNCRGCHTIGGKGGTIGPNLSFEGERVNPEWLVKFLQKPIKIRPSGILPTRMPTFGFSEQEATAMAAYFADTSKADYPYYLPEKKVMSATDTEASWKFYFQSFSCQACHAWNGQGGIIGPDQSDLGNRLRKEWIARWLADPQKYIPDVRMPNFELYPDEAEKLTNLMMTFTDISPSIWAQIKKRWEDEQLARQAEQMEGN